MVMLFIYNIVKRVNNFISNPKPHYFPVAPRFTSIPLQSGIFTMNRKMIIGLLSSIITAAMGYGIRLILLNYVEYDVFTNLDNWIASLSYFCSLGGIRFVINECLKEKTFLMSYCGSPMAVSNNTAGSGSLPVTNGVGSNAAGYNSSMQAPNNSAIPSSSGGDASITNDRSKLEQKVGKVKRNITYYHEQVEGSKQELHDIEATRSQYVNTGRAEEWTITHYNAMSALRDSYTNLHSEIRMYNIIQKRLEDGNYSMSETSATKRVFSDIDDGNSSTPSNTKHRSDNQ